MTSGTDVRQWLRDQGEDVSVKGPLPKGARERYDAAHGGEQLIVDGAVEEAGTDADYDGGVTEADFPSDPGPEADAVERAPRRVRSAPKGGQRFREKIWGGGKAGRPKKKQPRISLKGFAEDLFLDLAWTFQGLPPIEKVLYLQAPLAGQIVEDTCKGTVADAFLQPVARVDRQFKALEALTAPAWVAAIMVKGRRDEAGNYSPETKLMFGGLRHALLCMARITDLDFEQLRTKSEELKGKSDQIDQIIAWLFEMPAPPPEAPEPEPAMNGAAA